MPKKSNPAPTEAPQQEPEQVSTIRVTTIVLYAGGDFERLRELRQEIDRAEGIAKKTRERIFSGNARAGEGDIGDGEDGVARAQAAYDSFVVTAAGRARELRLRPIGSKRFRALMKEHPPRTEPDEEGQPVVVDADRMQKVNTETFPHALIKFHDPDYQPLYPDDPNDVMRTMLAPRFATPERFDRFLDDEIDEGEFYRLWTTAYYLNRTPGADPKASRSWETPQTSLEI